VLFADKTVQDFVREHFVAAWESVRPVPIVSIDFGNGHSLQRTLNGNVATYVCAPDGQVIDVIPGLCDAETYVNSLREALELLERTHGDSGALAQWHVQAAVIARDAAARAALGPEPTARRLDISKALVEDPLKIAMRRDKELVAEDGRRNLLWRRPIVHDLLSRPGLRPRDITRSLYFSALHVDLDDPWLGLNGGPFGGGAYGGADVDVLRGGPVSAH
jgi:hypothetical protein